MPLRKTFSLAERVAIAELCHAAELMVKEDGTPISEMHQCLGAMFLERAAGIVRGEVLVRPYTNADVNAFVAFWKAEERATFNPKE